MRLTPRSTRMVVLLASGFALAACSASQSRFTPAGTKPVKVKVRCLNNKLDVAVDPFTVELKDGEAVFWTPGRKWHGGVDRNDVAVTIVPKDPAQWPFATRPTMPADAGVSSGPETATGERRVSYNLRFTCDIDGVPREIEVDPDIIIRGSTTQ